MNDLRCKDLIGMFRGDFGALWHCQERGKSLEITTPYLYPDNSFVSIFVTKRGPRFIVSDGGNASQFFQAAKDDEAFFASVISRARMTHGVEEFKKADRTFYFKETKEAKLISSIAFDVANFLVASSHAASLATAEEDSLDKNSFRVRADAFIKRQTPKGRIVKFNAKFDQIKEATFSASVMSGNKVWLIIYLTGSNLKYFQLNTANAIFNVELAQKSSLRSHFSAIIPFLNDEAIGYQPSHLTERLGSLVKMTGNEVVPWRRKEEIVSQLA